jgi:peroxiredoxin
MTTQTLKSIAAALAVAASVFAAPPPIVDRQSPEFTITESSGKTALLSSFKGKVVVIEFLFIKSPHCLRVAEMLNRLHTELGPRGFQPIAIAFAPPGSVVDGPAVGSMVDYFKLQYPVGYTSSDKVDRYLGRTSDQIMKIPQIVVIDRAGVIRAQNGLRYDPNLEAEGSLRGLIDRLLKESGPADGSSRPVSEE